MTDPVTLLVGTRKGAFIYRGDAAAADRDSHVGVALGRQSS